MFISTAMNPDVPQCAPYLFIQIGEYDSDEEGGLWGDDEYGSGSDASWETESEVSVTEAAERVGEE